MSGELRKPQALAAGDRIAVVAPASGFDRAELAGYFFITMIVCARWASSLSGKARSSSALRSRRARRTLG